MDQYTGKKKACFGQMMLGRTYAVLLFGKTVFSFHVRDFRKDDGYFCRLLRWHRFIVNAQKHHRQVIVWAGIFLGFDAFLIGDDAEQ